MKYWQFIVEEWRVCLLFILCINIEILIFLELKWIEICLEIFLRVVEDFGEIFEEFFLNEVYFKVEQLCDWNVDLKKVLWIGFFNVCFVSDCQWIVMVLCGVMLKLCICWVFFLVYDLYLCEDIFGYFEFDFIDLCGFGCSVF